MLVSVGSEGDSYDDNVAAASLNGLYKTELIRERGLDAVKLSTLECVNWFNHCRLHSHCGDIPPVEFENNGVAQLVLRLVRPRVQQLVLRGSSAAGIRFGGRRAPVIGGVVAFALPVPPCSTGELVTGGTRTSSNALRQLS